MGRTRTGGVVIVTGGASGIGLAVVERLHADGLKGRRRRSQPREIAAAVAFLASADASYITGQSLLVDGGMTIDGDWYA